MEESNYIRKLLELLVASLIFVYRTSRGKWYVCTTDDVECTTAIPKVVRVRHILAQPKQRIGNRSRFQTGKDENHPTYEDCTFHKRRRHIAHCYFEG